MIAIYAEKPDMGTKIAAALFGIPLENGVVVTFSQLEKYERQIKAQRTKNGYFKIRYQGQEAYVTWGYGHMCTLKELPDIDIRYQNWKNIPLPYIPDHYELTNNGIAWIEDGSTGLGISVHPNLDKSGSVTGMKKLGYWDKSDRIVLSHGWKYNIDRFVCE